MSHGNIRHGLAAKITIAGVEYRDPTYVCWKNMWARCTNANLDSYARYGGSGITVCEEWTSFEAFLHDMGRRPSAFHTLDRIDGTQGYSKGNCRWTTYSVQAQNRTGWGKPRHEIGVGFDSRNRTWRARVKRNNRSYFVGNFSTKEFAVEARLKFIRDLGSED